MPPLCSVAPSPFLAWSKAERVAVRALAFRPPISPPKMSAYRPTACTPVKPSCQMAVNDPPRSIWELAPPLAGRSEKWKLIFRIFPSPFAARRSTSSSIAFFVRKRNSPMPAPWPSRSSSMSPNSSPRPPIPSVASFSTIRIRVEYLCPCRGRRLVRQCSWHDRPPSQKTGPPTSDLTPA